MNEPPSDLETSVERAAWVTYLLTGLHVELTTSEVARLTGLSRSGALRLLQNISRVAPIYQDAHFIWRQCRDE